MKLTNMKLDPKESKGEIGAPTAIGEKDKGPKYPYELELRLNRSILKKLGITTLTDLPKVGTKVRIEAEANVVTVRYEEREGDEDSLGVNLQIEEFCFEEGKESKKEKTDEEHRQKVLSPTKK